MAHLYRNVYIGDSRHLYSNVCMQVSVARALADSPEYGLLGGAKLTEICDSLPWTPINRRAKFDVASFILGGEIRNRTNTQTNTQTVNNISTPCLSACVDNNISFISL